MDTMRESGKNLDNVKRRVEKLKGTKVVLRVNEGRNRINCYNGAVDKTYPSVFTFRLEDEKIKTFSYSEVQTKSVKFLRPNTQLSQ